MEVSLPKAEAKLKSFVQDLDKILLKKALELARGWYKEIIEQLDEVIAEEREKALTIEHSRGVWYQTCLGAVKVKRRQYRESEGRYIYLLDEMLGMDKHWHVTVGVQKLASELATVMPYRRSAEVLRKTLDIDMAHQSIWRIINRIADPHLEKAEKELKWFTETGEIPDGEARKVARLMVEADGVLLSLQREKGRKAEVKLGIAYEGWEKIGKDRYRTLNKTAFAAVAGEQAFWAGMSLNLQRKYDLSRIGETIVGGDGARWVKEGADYINGHFQLDRYHLNRELTMALGKDKETKSKVWQACQCGDIDTGLHIMADAMRQSRGDQAKKIAKAYHYLSENQAGLEDYRLRLGEKERKGLRGTGAIEGNVDKLVVRRMKNQGMSWTIKGIRRLLCVRFLVREGKLTEWLDRRNTKDPHMPIPPKTLRRLVNRLSMQQPDDWLKAEVPALHGPHASRPWAIILKSLLEAPTYRIAPLFGFPTDIRLTVTKRHHNRKL